MKLFVLFIPVALMAQIPNPFGGGGSGGGGGGAGTCGTLGGDLSGTCTSGEVTGILSNALPALSTGYLNWNGSAWVFTSGTGANAALSNLASVSINTALLFQTTTDVGSTTKPARNLYLYGTGTYGTNYFQITGAPTSTRTITIPDTTDTLVTLAATQTLTNKSIAASQLTGQVAVANGGTGTTSPALVAGTNVTITGSWPNQTINSSGGGGGGTGNAAATHSVTFSATPTYTCSSASAGTVEEFTLSTALSANVTSSTLATCTAGEVLNFTYTQSAASGPFTVVMPTNFDACPVSPTASAVTTCGYSYDGTNGRLVGSTSNDTPSVLLLSATRAAPTVVPSGGAAWPDSTDNDFEYRQTGGGSIFKMFLSGGDANPVTGVVSKINGTAFSGTSGHLVSFGAANIPADSGVVAANAVVASSPGAGLAHFAGSTQTVTSSAVSLTGDVSGVLPFANGGTGNGALGTSLLYSNGSAISLATAHRGSVMFACADSSGSGTAQSCTSAPTFTLATGDLIIYSTTTQNTGDVTLAVNSGAAVHLRKYQGSSVLASGDLKANVPVPLVYDGTYWEIGADLGNAPAGGNPP